MHHCIARTYWWCVLSYGTQQHIVFRKCWSHHPCVEALIPIKNYSDTIEVRIGIFVATVHRLYKCGYIATYTLLLLFIFFYSQTLLCQCVCCILAKTKIGIPNQSLFCKKKNKMKFLQKKIGSWKLEIGNPAQNFGCSLLTADCSLSHSNLSHVRYPQWFFLHMKNKHEPPRGSL